MRLGVYTRYHRHEATYAAIRVAEHAKRRGWDASLLTDDRHQARVCRIWDSAVIAAGPGKFTEWAAKMNVIFWTHVPPEGQIHWATKQGKRTVVLVLWHELRTCDRKALKQASLVLCPSKVVATVLRKRWKLTNVIVCHWDAGLPITTQDDTTPVLAPRVLLPTDLLCPQFSPEIGAMLDQVLMTCPDTTITVSYVPSRWQGDELSQLRGLSRGGRLTLLPSIREHDRPLLFQQHDLTLWPCLQDNMAYGAMYSLAVGTPVLAFASPVAENMITNTDSVVVPCKLRENALGIPTVVPDYATYLQFLLGVLIDPLMIPAMRPTEPDYLLDRRACFDAFWNGVLCA